MPKLNPVAWRIFVSRLRDMGWSGPFQEGKHPYMIKGTWTLTIPNPHEGDIGVDLLVRLLRQAGISRTKWMK